MSGPKLEGERLSAALAAQRDMRAPRPKRFFASAHVVDGEDGFALHLDGKPALTPARRPLALPTRPAAEALAAEWNRLGETIDPALMPLTRIVNAALDGVAGQDRAVFDEVAAYVGSDLLLYRAAEPEALEAEQARSWDPVLDWCREAFGARFILAQGVMHVAQPAASLSIMRQALAEAIGEGRGAVLRLTALSVMTTLTGSAMLALAVASGQLSPEDAWRAAHIDEEFQERAWGQDAEALQRRTARWAEMEAAALLARQV